MQVEEPVLVGKHANAIGLNHIFAICYENEVDEVGELDTPTASSARAHISEFVSYVAVRRESKHDVGCFAVRLHGGAAQGAESRMVRGEAARWGFTKGKESDGSR